MKLCLRSNVAYPWTVSGDNCFRGYFIYDDILYEKELAINFLVNHYDKNDYSKVLYSLNGVFSFVLSISDDLVFSVDRLRGLPMFYSIIENEVIVGDNIEEIANFSGGKKYSNESKADLLSSDTFVLGHYTLLKGVFQVRAGEYCVYSQKERTFQHEQYYITNHDVLYSDSDIELLQQHFWNAYKRTGDDMVRALKNRTAVIPLSGGADSRMLLELLVKAGYKNIICYTYGKTGNSEANISRRVAEENGCKWIFVPYTKKMWKRIKRSKERIIYEDFASSFVSTPHFQDFPAVKYLKENNLIPEDSVFIPGHSGDIPNGNHVAGVYMNKIVTKSDCLQSILRFTYHNTSKSTMDRLNQFYPLPDQGTPQEYATIEEWFDTAERQAKYIVNSVRVYEFFGYEWLIPLWDNNQLEFWSHISLNWRYKRRLYYELTKGDKLPSTNDPSIGKSLAVQIRKIPVVESVVRRTKKIMNWISSPLLMEHLFDWRTYFIACFKEYSSFNVVTLICKNNVKRLIK